MRQCSKCKVVKPLSDFYKRKGRPSGVHSQCKECIKKNRKQEYVKITRKLRNYVSELKKQNKISPEDYKRLRKEIKARVFKSKGQLKENLEAK